MRRYEIRFGSFLANVTSTIQCACDFEITPAIPSGQEFYFKICLGRRYFEAFVSTLELGLKEEDAKWILLKYGLEETERDLRDGNEKDGNEIKLCQEERRLSSCPEITEAYKNELLQEFISSETSEKLPKLPRGVVFPVHLQDKIRYDTAKQLLIFTRDMSEKEKDELLSLSQDELYRKAIAALFQKSQHKVIVVTFEV